MATVEVRIGSSLTSAQLLFGGVFAPYVADMDFTLNAANPLVMGLNHALSSVVPTAGQRTVSLPLRLDGTGSVYLAVNTLETQASVKPLTLEVANVTDTLVPGNDWVETAATFDFSKPGRPGCHHTCFTVSMDCRTPNHRRGTTIESDLPDVVASRHAHEYLSMHYCIWNRSLVV